MSGRWSCCPFSTWRICADESGLSALRCPAPGWEIVRALATNPSLLLLDEPAAGMNPSETAELMENIRKIRDTFQIAVLLIEHDMNWLMNICEGLCVLNLAGLSQGNPGGCPGQSRL